MGLTATVAWLRRGFLAVYMLALCLRRYQHLALPSLPNGLPPNIRAHTRARPYIICKVKISACDFARHSFALYSLPLHYSLPCLFSVLIPPCNSIVTHILCMHSKVYAPHRHPILCHVHSFLITSRFPTLLLVQPHSLPSCPVCL
jgi:hypothetical protein